MLALWPNCWFPLVITVRELRAISMDVRRPSSRASSTIASKDISY